MLLAAAGFAHAGRLGLAGLVLVALLWALDGAPAEKSNVRDVAEAIAPSLHPGDLVVSTQPEQISVLDYYLPDGLRYATLTGAVPDPGVTDWRDGVERLEATSAERDLQPLLDSMQPGQRLALVVPEITSINRWRAPWTDARAAAHGGVAADRLQRPEPVARPRSSRPIRSRSARIPCGSRPTSNADAVLPAARPAGRASGRRAA